MKLRDSFISIQHISNELNIPLASIECGAKVNEIFPSDYELVNNEKSSVAGSDNVHQEKTIIDSNIKIIDKATKVNGMRVRNLKKSMLNDNKLIRLKDKLLRRSKSTVGLSTKSENAIAQKSNNNVSKEEHQNKENELPKYSESMQKMHLMQAPPKIMSPNRNRVKMGTRVFSSQFLNKSYDNIFDNTINAVYNFDEDFDNDLIRQQNSIQKPMARSKSRCSKNTKNDNFDGCTTDSSSNGRKYLSSSTDADRLSLRSTSLSSIYFSEKMSENLCDSPLPTEAYVIRK